MNIEYKAFCTLINIWIMWNNTISTAKKFKAVWINHNELGILVYLHYSDSFMAFIFELLFAKQQQKSWGPKMF